MLVDSLTAWSVAPFLMLDADRSNASRRSRRSSISRRAESAKVAVRTALQRPLDQALYRRCELLIVASTALADELVDLHGLPGGRICVVEPGSDLPIDRLGGSSTRDDLRRGRRIALLCVGNWLPNKGVLELLDAVAALPADRRTLHLVGRDDVDPGIRRPSRGTPAAARPDVAASSSTESSRARRSAGCTAAPTSSSCPATPRRTERSSARRWPPACRRSDGDRATSPTSSRTAVRDVSSTPGDIAALSATLERLSTDDEWRERLRSAAAVRGETLPTWDDAADAFFGALRRLAGPRG